MVEKTSSTARSVVRHLFFLFVWLVLRSSLYQNGWILFFYFSILYYISTFTLKIKSCRLYLNYLFFSASLVWKTERVLWSELFSFCQFFSGIYCSNPLSIEVLNSILYMAIKGYPWNLEGQSCTSSTLLLCTPTISQLTTHYWFYSPLYQWSKNVEPIRKMEVK